MEDVPVCINDFEEPARKKLTRNAYTYYSSGADDQQTLKENQNAFKRLDKVISYFCNKWKIVPLPRLSICLDAYL